MKDYVFDLSIISSLEDWWEMYVSVVRGPGFEMFGRNRDAYSDSLDGGPCCPEVPCNFIFTNTAKLTGEKISEMTKVEFMKMKSTCHSSNILLIDSQLELLKYGRGETILNWIIDPVYGREGINVLVKPGG